MQIIVSDKWLEACGHGPECKTLDVIRVQIPASPMGRFFLVQMPHGGTWVVAEERCDYVTADRTESLKVGDTVVVNTAFGLGPEVRVRVESLGEKNGRPLFDYRLADGGARWAYLDQIVEVIR